MSKTSLRISESHPMAPYALQYIRSHILIMDIESMNSMAQSGSRAGEICLATWERIEKGEPVSDRYLMGLAWLIQQLHEQRKALDRTNRD